MPPDDASIACSLNANDAATREARWRSVAAAALIKAERTTSGARQTYRRDGKVERELAELIELEAACCPFLEFELSNRPGEVVLDVRAPAQAAGIIELFAGERQPAP